MGSQLIVKLTLIVAILPICLAQQQENATQTKVIPMQHSKKLKVCGKDDRISSMHCKCSAQVVSCDFTNFSLATTLNVTESDHVELDVYGFLYPPNATRLCLCNSPSNLHLKLTRGNFLPRSPTNNFLRFDFYNLSGELHFSGGFQSNFNGDLVISNAKLIPEISGDEFGRGDDFHGGPVYQNNLDQCCSTVKLNEKYKKPVLYMEHSKINYVATRGFNDHHLWKTVILNGMSMRNIEYQGLIFDSHQAADIAVLSSDFKNASAQSLNFMGTKNLIIAKNKFSQSVHAIAVNGISDLDESNLAIFGNTFSNQMFMDFDASKIVIQHNHFDLWDYLTLNQTRLSRHFLNRNISIRYNAADVYENHANETFVFGKGTLSLEDNIYGGCNCSLLNIIKDKVDFHLNWCYTGNVAQAPEDQHNCSIKLNEALKHCDKSKDTDFYKLCATPDGIKVVNGLASIRKDVTGVLPGLTSDFIKAIFQDFGFLLGFKGVKIRYDDGDQHNSSHIYAQNNNNNSNLKRPASSSTTAISVAVSLIVLVLFVVFVFVFRSRGRIFGRYGNYNREELAGSREVML